MRVLTQLILERDTGETVGICQTDDPRLCRLVGRLAVRDARDAADRLPSDDRTFAELLRQEAQRLEEALASLGLVEEASSV